MKTVRLLVPLLLLLLTPACRNRLADRASIWIPPTNDIYEMMSLEFMKADSAYMSQWTYRFLNNNSERGHADISLMIDSHSIVNELKIHSIEIATLGSGDTIREEYWLMDVIRLKKGEIPGGKLRASYHFLADTFLSKRLKNGKGKFIDPSIGKEHFARVYWD